MSNAYITLWSQPQIEVQQRFLLGDDDTLSHTANDQFRDVGVAPGDRVYVVGTRKGQLLLLGRIAVERVVDQDEAEHHFGHAVYRASDHLIGEGTVLCLDRVVPEHIARALERGSGKRLKVAPDVYRVNVHSLRRTGRITADSAARLDTLL
jgi:hypothetical protein